MLRGFHSFHHRLGLQCSTFGTKGHCFFGRVRAENQHTVHMQPLIQSLIFFFVNFWDELYVLFTLTITSFNIFQLNNFISKFSIELKKVNSH